MERNRPKLNTSSSGFVLRLRIAQLLRDGRVVLVQRKVRVRVCVLVVV